MKNRLKIVAYGKDTRIPKSLSNYMYTRKGTQIDARYFKAAIEDTLYDDDGNYIGKLDAKKICDELNTDKDTLRTFTPYSSSGNNVKILATDYMGNEDIISITNLLNESLLIEDLKRWDKKEFRDNSNCYELEMLYESNKTMLSSQQKNELSRFVRKARTAEEINTYMTGMLAQGTNEALEEAFDKEPHEFWYYTKHGLGPGTVPRDVEILDVYEDDNWGTYIKLDKVLTTDELNYYDLKEKVPEGLE